MWEDKKPPKIKVKMGILTHDKWFINAHKNEKITLTYTADKPVCFIVDNAVHVVEPVAGIATLQVSAESAGPIHVYVEDKHLVLAAL